MGSRRRCAALGVATMALGCQSFVAVREAAGKRHMSVPTTGKQVSFSTLTGCTSTLTSSITEISSTRRGGRARTARRLFDTGSFFGVGVPEALVIALLGWFLLGPEELFKISKKVGGWLGELRSYIGQAARQYESALDDKSTRQAIEGLRQTQQTVSELAGSWRSVTDSLRDPLAISSTLQTTFDKYSPNKPQVPPAPELNLDASVDGEKEPIPPAAKAKGDKGAMSPVAKESEESEEELEEKKAQSRQAVSDMWYREEEDGAALPKAAESFLARLDTRLDEIEALAPELDAVKTAATRLEELRKGVLEDRAAIREIVLQNVEKKETAKANQEA